MRSAIGDLPREILSDVLLCVTELVTNTVTHPESETDEEVEVSVARTPRLLRVEVAEPRRGVVVERAKRTPGDPAFGLYIVELLSDRWGVARGERRRIWFEKDLSVPAS